MNVAMRGIVGVQSRGILRLPFLGELVGMAIQPLGKVARRELTAVAEWGRRRRIHPSLAWAKQSGLPCLALEDGFLRSLGTGEHFPPLSIVVDEIGVFYDSTRPSTLENLLNSGDDLLAGIAPDVARARALILRHRLSKYNHAPDWSGPQPARAASRKVLVVDQTAGDMSVTLGGADAGTFEAMLAAARRENPGATIYVKTHPEVSSGRKRGYLTKVRDDADTVVLREAINPLSLMEHMDRVYVVSSTMGFEALLAGKTVTCFGLPWYAGWGATDDRQPVPRRKQRRTVDELFAAAYFRYTRYLNPATRRQGSIFDVIEWLVRQKETIQALRGHDRPSRLVCVGVPRWKASNLRPILATTGGELAFVRSAQAARRLHPGAGDWFVFWGADVPAGLAKLAGECGGRLVRMEDGFVRSVGLGSDLIRPQSLVLDAEGIYFDPGQPSVLESLLNTTEFSAEELERARQVRAFIVAHQITKYNMEPRTQPAWDSRGRTVVLVPGQVEDDASIRLGSAQVKTNLALLEAVRHARPQAFIVYKPHPDVVSGNRAGKLALAGARAFADHVETDVSVVRCIEAADEVHTITSLTGFDALLRGRKVVTYGQPFYAGWGLTEDAAAGSAALARRTRRLGVDALVAGALLRYPVYWDWELRGYTTCEAVLARIVETRNALEASGQLDKLRVGLVRRQVRKLQVVARAWLRWGKE
jgi:capsular polysaccharide export protein